MKDNAEQSIPSRGSVAKCHACGADCVEGYDAEGVLVRVPVRGRWIPVSERLPEVHATVLAVTRAFPKDIRLAQMASHDGVMWRFCDMDDDDVDSFGITHWMPLPAPPTDGK